ncbi:amino acid permease-domain-containing protein [Phyllosticta citribraziliensis]|uniref:Amino acid permease-domain-containing protein n=1 Tax=Phyllosticta citribraziliensis TaxID=989973 RepID=A0ABR1M5J6_9PEZI
MSSRMPPKSHSNFATRSAQDSTKQLTRRWSIYSIQQTAETDPLLAPPRTPKSTGTSRPSSTGWTSFFSNLLGTSKNTPSASRATSRAPSIAPSVGPSARKKRHVRNVSSASGRRSVSNAETATSEKMTTFTGVFVPTTLNVLSILMFLRFGFILGQSGLLGMMGMLIACYAINLLTTLSISAIATNGTVRGGGAYYLISRSLGPEFGGSIGVVFYLGFVLNTGMNAVGLVTCFTGNFGSSTGTLAHWLPEGFWWQYLWSTAVLVICTAICFAGSGLFARCSNGLLIVLLVATFSIPVSAIARAPFESKKFGIEFTGLSLDTLRGNMLPHLTSGAAGSQLKGRETWQDLFGILFPATGGIFAGASMSGDLKSPSKSIPKGTLHGLALTFVTYTAVILAMAMSVTRASLYHNANVIQLTNISETLILLGEVASTFFSTLMGVIGSAKLLQALARDKLIPGLSIFGKGTKGADEPIYAIIITYALSQIVMLADINQIASFVTMTYLMTFMVTNLACFLLKIASAPNFRPSFHYFNSWTAAIGTVISAVIMFFVDGFSATICFIILTFIFLLIHYTTPPKPWGDVSQSLIYHQVRKYLLRLRQEHVKFWRPQILLFINDPRRQYKLIQFCNSIKKGGLFVLGHVIVTNDFAGAVPEAKAQQTAWKKYIDFSRIKAFINVVVSPDIEWGTRNVVLSAGLGGMKPNMVFMGFYNLNDLRTHPLAKRCSSVASRHNNPPNNSLKPKSKRKQAEEDKFKGTLPTDAIRKESAVNPRSYVTILEDLLLRLQMNVAIAKGFQDLDLPFPKPSTVEKCLGMLHMREAEEEENTTKYIDLWPIQMAAEIAAAGPKSSQSVLTTNFDTYTLILQLGCILSTVPSWQRAYTLRVAVFVEYESDVDEERRRVATLLADLRIEAEVLVFWLASGNLQTYEIIVNGNVSPEYAEVPKEVEESLKDEFWWEDMQRLRKSQREPATPQEEISRLEGFLESASNWPGTSFLQGDHDAKPKRFADLKKALKTRRRTSMRSLRQFGVNLNMRTHGLDLAGAEYASEDALTTSSDSDVEDENAVASTNEEPDEVASENDVDEIETWSSDEEDLLPLRRAISDQKDTRDLAMPRKAIGRGIMPPQRSMPGTENQRPPHAGQSSQPSKDLGHPSDATVREQIFPKFTSQKLPETQVATDETTGPSIMFAEPHTAEDQRLRASIYARGTSPARGTGAYGYQADGAAGESSQAQTAAKTSASSTHSRNDSRSQGQSVNQSLVLPLAGLPPVGTAAALPLSFNDLPCRAQHLILNELIKKESGDGETAVVFTTLPSPVEGTCESEESSVQYLSDLEVLCDGLPPVVLVHSNSLTVTMNL